MTFQSINKINSSSPPNITAHGASAPWSDVAIAVAFRYTGSKPRLAFLLIKAVLSPLGKCACIPLVRSVLLYPIPFPHQQHHLHHATGGEGMRGERRPVPCSCALIPSTWPEAQMCTRATATIWTMRVPCGTQHLQMQPYYLTWWCTYRTNKNTSGKNSFNLSNQTYLDWGTIQKCYCTLIISSAHERKSIRHSARTQLAIRWTASTRHNVAI